MYKIIKVIPFDNFKLYIEFSDGLNGEINFNKMLKRKEYEQLNDLNEFKKVFVDQKTKDITWQCGVKMCKIATRNMLELKQDIKKLNLPI